MEPRGSMLHSQGAVAIPSNGQNIFYFSHIEGITLSAGEEVD